MGRYVERNLYENELIVMKAKINRWPLLGTWLFGIFFCWLLLIPLIRAIIKTIKYAHMEFAVTNKRVFYKTGVFAKRIQEVPLNKIYEIKVGTTFWGNVFNVNRFLIRTEDSRIPHEGCIKLHDIYKFKNAVLAEMHNYEETLLALQAEAMRNARQTPPVKQEKEQPRKMRRR